MQGFSGFVKSGGLVTRLKPSMKIFENLLQSMADHTSSVIYLKDLEGKYILINRQHEKLFSIKNEDVKGKTDFDIFPEDIARSFRANDEQVLKSGQTMEMEEIAPHEDGPHTYISVKFPVRDSQGEIFGVGGISTDITPRKQMEEELRGYQSNLKAKVEEKTRSLLQANADLTAAKERMEFLGTGLENAGDSVFFLELETSRFVYVNQMACKSLGYTKDELLAMAVFDIDPDYQQENWHKFQKALSQEGLLTFESRHRARDGGIFPVEITTHLVQFQEKSYSIAFARNISDRKKIERDLVAAKTTAEQASKAKSEFISHMSHELRTPLNAILGFAQLLKLNREKTLAPRQKENVEQIQVAGHHLLDLINDVLDLTKIETGSLKVFKENVCVSKIADRLIPVVKSLAEKRQITIENHLNEPEEYLAFADPTRLKQALLNLITNAVKYNKDGGKVELKSDRDGEDKVRIHVIDTGEGIEDEKQQLIFEPFERLGFENSGIEGTGIGLTITKRLVAMMDGTIQVKSAKGKGSCFTITLPACDVSEKTIQMAPENKSKDILPDCGEGAGKSILYIEDNESSIRLIQKFIEEYTDFQLLISSNAQEGLRLAREARPSLILLDIDLPEMDGLTVFNRLQEWHETRSIPVIGLSAGAMNNEVNKALNMGFKDYIVKPVDLDYLASAISKNICAS